ncbi:TlpA family protein disulfide reductase [Flavobacterium sp. TMP13]|uniref:TlpA family protein disulfide reductase n=1 Tax=Flavobacterium sp. TMP13 TaxID=3425950 RepID=UPI003D7842B1
MKNITFIALLIVLMSCQNATPPKDYVVLHGKITNPIAGLGLRLFDPVSSQTVTIAVAQDGSYRDTIKLKEAAYFNAFYDKFFGLYLKNDMDLEINFDAKNVSKTLTFKGNGTKENDFLIVKSKLEGQLFGADYNAFINSDKATFDSKMAAFSGDVKSELDKQKAILDTAFVSTQLIKLQEFNTSLTQQFLDEQRNKSELGVGMASPEFKNYINYKGGKSSLSDFRGSYVFIDVWATWCGPCKYEMPFISKVEKAFHGKNIKFIGISVDRLADEKKWREMIVAQKLTGTQLLADNEIGSEFIAGYYIQAIPRFIILDKEGKIVSADAPRPSEPELTELLNSLDL